MKLWSYALLVVFFGCGFHAVPVEEAHRDKPSMDALKLDLEVEPRDAILGETLSFELTITNNFSEPLMTQWPNGCVYGFSISTSEGIRVAPKPPFCSMAPVPLRFQPGEVAVHRFKWVSGEYNISRGKYIVRAGFGQFGMTYSALPVEIELR